MTILLLFCDAMCHIHGENLNTKAEQQQAYLEHIYEKFSHPKIVELPMFPREVKGLERLREVGKLLFA